MRLRYTLSLDDLVALNMYYSKRSPHMKRTLALTYLLTVGFCFFALLLVVAYLRTQRWFLALFNTLLYAFLVQYVLFGRKKRIRRLYAEGKNKGLIGPHELEITEQDLVERTQVGERHTQWSAIDGVSTTPGHTFIFLSALEAHVIPRTTILDGNYEDFVNEVKKRTTVATASPSSSG